MLRITILLALFFMRTPDAHSQSFKPDWSSLDSRRIPAWFQDSKFGIFIHWGVYSVPAFRPLEKGLYASYAEWYYAKVYANEANGGKDFHEKNYGKDFEYRDFGPLFKAELWEPQRWAKLFKQSGARYVVLTSKHHDGYCLWPTKSPYKKNWNSMDVGPKRDLVGELATAVRSEGMKMGLYYSIIEWESSKTHRTPSGYYVPLEMVAKYKIPENEYADKHVIPQLKELVNNYKPSLLFFDGGEWDTDEKYLKAPDFLAWLYNQSPVKDEVVVNDRLVKDMPGNHGDYYSSEYNDAKFSKFHPWEESRGIGGSYGYNRAENLEDYSTSKQLVLELADIVSRGGNLLLNVGPTADGRIPVIAQQRLTDIGEWLKINGEAIYGTTKFEKSSDTINGHKVYFTAKPDATYIIFSHWPENSFNVNFNSARKIKDITLLNGNKKVSWSRKGNQVAMKLPFVNYNDLPAVDAWVLKIKY
jgi:alpha-L-fucosidase